MKLGAVDSIKFKKLKMRLGLAQWQAIGLLESIWMFAARNSPLGDIGRHSNEDIAIQIEWSEDADTLISALVDVGWLDRDEEHRLLVHDWAEHLPMWLKGNLHKHGKEPISRIQQVAKEVAEQPAKQPAKQAAKHGARQPAQQPALEAAILSSDLYSSDLSSSSSWREVEEGMNRLNVIGAQKAIAAAESHGFTPPQVLALVAYLETPPPKCQDPAAALVHRLVEIGAVAVDWDCDERWPWSKPAKVRRPAPSGNQALDEIKARDERIAANRARLIAAHAATLEAMDDSELDALISLAPEASRQTYRIDRSKWPKQPGVYVGLLDLIDKREMES